MLEDFVFDYSDFYERLLLASREGFQLLKDRHTNETFYCFAFYSHGSGSFLYPAASTEEGLTRAAQRYIDTHLERYGKFTLAEMRTRLRHSIADSPLNDSTLMLPVFQEICDLAEARSTGLFEVWSRLSDKFGDDKAFELVEPHDRQFLETCFAVLRQLETEGMFGTPQHRERVILNFLTGDQSTEELLTYAAALNPLHIVERYRAEWLAGLAIWR
jgi:uncharacterized protein DUF4303